MENMFSLTVLKLSFSSVLLYLDIVETNSVMPYFNFLCFILRFHCHLVNELPIFINLEYIYQSYYWYYSRVVKGQFKRNQYNAGMVCLKMCSVQISFALFLY